jgi:hypothetical protein
MNIEAGVFEIGAIRKASMRRLLTALLGLAAGYFVFALAGYCAIEFYSNNGFDRSLEALMTVAFAVAPAGALIELVGGLIFGGRFSRHLPRRACLAASCASVRLQRVIGAHCFALCGTEGGRLCQNSPDEGRYIDRDRRSRALGVLGRRRPSPARRMTADAHAVIIRAAAI